MNSKFIIKLFLAFISALLVWEIILETTVIKTPLHRNHPELGEIFSKGLYVWGEEGYSISHINSLGMRNREITPKKSNEYRVLMLGDSFTEGYQVPENNTYTRILEEKLNLNNKDKRFYNVINAGKARYSPADYIYLSKFWKKTLNPDFVFIEINDWDFSLEILDKKLYCYVKPDKNTFKLIKNKNFVSNNDIRQKYPGFTFLTNFSVLRVGYEQMEKMFEKADPIKPNKKEFSNDKKVLYANLIDWTVKSLKDSYKNIYVIYIPDISYFDNPSKMSYYEECFLKSAKKYNLPMFSTRKSFVDYYNQYKQPPNGFNNGMPGTGHINKIGHRIVAEKTFDYLKNEVLK